LQHGLCVRQQALPLQQSLALDAELFAWVKPNEAAAATINRKYFIEISCFEFH
jgi:hypothetical protein